ncbi:MAG: IS21-like element helper ATPase IstB [Defluviitaleaceae bacterium]|nr:IS21-like element helper ATPase IstB [Defluviitaleaceae bacterium]
MMIHQTAEKLRAMKLPAMATEYIRQSELPAMSALDFDERVGMMADAEWLSRDNSRVKRLTKDAKLRYPAACFADIDFRPSRKLDRAYIARLTDFAWAKEARNMILTGSTGTGKTWLACAFGTQACRIGLRVMFYRMNRLLGDMAVAAGTGCADKFLDKLKKCDILILDDWGLSALTLLEGKFLHEVFEVRYGEKSTIISAQLPVSEWHGLFEDRTAADAVLDRVVHNSYRLELQGPTMRLDVSKAAASFGGDGEHDA